MENAVEALKIAFAVMMFVAALSLSISCFSQANAAVTSIISLNDRETEYTYVEPSSTNTRTVGVETIVPTMYKAYQENFQIYFYQNKEKTQPFVIYTKTDNVGNSIDVNYIDGSEVFGNAQEAVNHLDNILNNGLYESLSGKKFIEELGEYYQNDSENTPEVNKTKTRVITYTLVY